MTLMEAAICVVVNNMEMFRLTITKSFKTEELGTNPFMMFFYIEESRDKPLDVVCVGSFQNKEWEV